MACIWFLPAAAQEAKEPEAANFLPPTTGDPLTVKPIDLPDVNCTIVGWKSDADRPVLSLLCPPKAVFAPLRVYVKLSWMHPADVSAEGIVAPVNAETRIRTNKKSAMVWLKTARSGGILHYEWVPFNGVVDMALIVESSSHKIH